jgi:RNA polymerase sigma-70 factor (ECF subfamily)
MKSHAGNDSELIERIKRRDPDGLAAAYDGYGPIAYSVLLRITRDRSVAEDLLQELFLRLWNRAHDFDVNRGGLGVWIVSIARNMAIDYIRSAQARFHHRLRSIEDVDPSRLSGNPPANAESILDICRTVSAAFTNLNENEKRVLQLAYFEGCSQSEIAARLNEPLGTVKSWVRSGLGRLRAAMKVGAVK